MTKQQAACFAFTQVQEGPYSNDARDSGNWSTGITGQGQLIGSKFGIGAPALLSWMHPNEHLVTPAYMKSLPPAVYSAMASAKYWRPLQCDNLWAGLDLMLFDYGWNRGISNSARQLQEALGFAEDDQDGDIGPMSMLAIRGVNDHERFLHALAAVQTEHYCKLSNFAIYGRGWLARTDRRLAEALAMLPTIPLFS